MDNNNVKSPLIKFKKWLNKPYYFDYSTSFKLKISFGFGLLVFILLVIFRPGGANSSDGLNLFYQFTFGCITTCNLLLFFFVIIRVFHKFFNEENWTVGKHLLTILSVIVFSSIIRWIYLTYIVPDEFGAKGISLLKMIQISFSLGSLIVLLFIYLDEKHQYKKYSTSSEEIKDKRPTLISQKNKNEKI